MGTVSILPPLAHKLSIRASEFHSSRFVRAALTLTTLQILKLLFKPVSQRSDGRDGGLSSSASRLIKRRDNCLINVRWPMPADGR